MQERPKNYAMRNHKSATRSFKNIFERLEECHSKISHNEQEFQEFQNSMELRLNTILEKIETSARPRSPAETLHVVYYEPAPIEQPVLRKFRPPPSRQQLREQAALETQRGNPSSENRIRIQSIESLYCKENVSKAFSQDDSLSSTATLEEEVQPQSNNKIIVHSIETLSFGEKLSPVQSIISTLNSKSKVHEERRDFCKYHHINAWLAKSTPDRSFKVKSTLSAMLHKEKLIATYKCMDERCSFTSTSSKFFTKHLGYHVSSLAPSQFLFLCPYCVFEGSSIDELIKHYEQHSNEKFQCAYCFFRSVSDCACWNHVMTHHTRKPMLVYECPLKEAEHDEKVKSRQRNGREENVSQLKCSSKCEELK